MKSRGTTSSAVMAQRIEPRDSLDFFPTPPWATRALLKYGGVPMGTRAWEPCAGAGHMVRPLREAGLTVHATDVHDYGGLDAVHDFLAPYAFAPECVSPLPVPWVITNPPFRLAAKIVIAAREVAANVALLVRLQFLEGLTERAELFDRDPPADILLFRERVTMLRGRCQRKTDTGSDTASAYCWVIWRDSWSCDRRPVFGWIPRCRTGLERSGDYDGDS